MSRKLRLFIVDDEAPARARLRTLMADIAVECPHLIVGEAENAVQALAGIASSQPDILLLDVQMPGISGIALAAQLTNLAYQSATPAPAIIFISAYEEYALQAFEVQALDYLLKPVRASRLAAALQRFKPVFASDHPAQVGRQHFSVQERGRILLVPIDDVLYLKAELKYVTLHTKAREYLIEASLVSLEHELAATFVRVHRNALVARSAICGVERATGLQPKGEDHAKGGDCWQVILRDATERLPISRRQWPVLKALVR